MAKRVTTLFIRDTSINLLVMKGEQIEKWASLPLEPGLVSQGLLVDEEQVADKVKKQRSQKMLALAEETAANFRKRFLGRTMPVLWEQKNNGIWSGLTGNYIRVYTRSSEDLANQITEIKLENLYKDGVWGELW